MKDLGKLVKKSDYDDLKRSYMDECSDKEFFKFVSSLPIEEDLLIKYTSTLKESFLECQNCLKCKSLDKCKNSVNGYYLYPEKTGKSITFSYLPCKKKVKDDEKHAYLENIDYYSLSKELQEASFKNVYKYIKCINFMNLHK